MAKCKCGETGRWRMVKKRTREKAKYQVICLACEFTWWTDNVSGIPKLTEEERALLAYPNAM
jgi:hypothetical protein